MKVNIVCVGKIKEKFFTDAIAEYQKRLSRFCNFNIINLYNILLFIQNLYQNQANKLKMS